jgi:predicted dehydrogenase
MDTVKTRVALLGCGWIGHSHAVPLSQMANAELVQVVDIDHDRARAFGDRYGVAYGTDVGAVMSNDAVDAVIVATANNTHAALAIRAMEAGKHVLVQKPMAISVAEADAMEAAQRRTGMRTMVSCFQMFHPAVHRAKQIIDAGLIGDVMLFKAFLGWYVTAPEAAWRFDPGISGGGILMDSAPHTLATFSYLLGIPQSTSVTGMVGTLGSRIAAEDTGVILLRTPGTFGEITASARILEPNRQLNISFKDTIEIFGTKGTIHLHLTEVPSLRVHVADATRDLLSGGWTEPLLDWVSFDERGSPSQYNGHEDPWLALHKHFVEAIRNDIPFLSDIAFGRRIIEVITAAYMSSAEGRAVQLDTPP